MNKFSIVIKQLNIIFIFIYHKKIMKNRLLLCAAR